MQITLRHASVGAMLSALAATGSWAQTAEAMPREELQVLATAFGEIKHSLVEKPDDRALIVAAIKGLLRGADPESGEYFTAEEFEALRQSMRTNQSAIGVELKIQDGQYLLVPLAGSPAAQAGVVFADQLHAVDGVRIKGLGVSAVASKLAGPPGTKVALTVFRESTLSVHTLQVERKAIWRHLTAVSNSMITVPNSLSRRSEIRNRFPAALGYCRNSPLALTNCLRFLSRSVARARAPAAQSKTERLV